MYSKDKQDGRCNHPRNYQYPVKGSNKENIRYNQQQISKEKERKNNITIRNVTDYEVI